MTKPNAIAMLVFSNEKYICGACITAFVHRYFIKKLGKDIKIVLMVDEKIYKLKHNYETFFDKIYQVPILELKLSTKYKFSQKYILF
jgi:hypothetical protein